MYTKFGSEILKGRDNSEKLCVDGRIILEWILRKYDGKVWAGYTCVRIGDQLRGPVDTVRNFRVSYKAWNFLTV